MSKEKETKIRFKSYVCWPRFGRYYNGRTAIQLEDEGGPVATATVNMVAEEGIKEDEVFIKDYSENTGMTQALKNAGIIEDHPIRSAYSGHVTVELYRLSDLGRELLKEAKEGGN